MHASDGKTSDNTRHNESRPEESLTWLADFDSGQTTEQEDDGQESGEGSEAWIVVQLNLTATIAENDGSISYEMHTPDCDETEGY